MVHTQWPLHPSSDRWILCIPPQLHSIPLPIPLPGTKQTPSLSLSLISSHLIRLTSTERVGFTISLASITWDQAWPPIMCNAETCNARTFLQASMLCLSSIHTMWGMDGWMTEWMMNEVYLLASSEDLKRETVVYYSGNISATWYTLFTCRSCSEMFSSVQEFSQNRQCHFFWNVAETFVNSSRFRKDAYISQCL